MMQELLFRVLGCLFLRDRHHFDDEVVDAFDRYLTEMNRESSSHF